MSFRKEKHDFLFPLFRHYKREDSLRAAGGGQEGERKGWGEKTKQAVRDKKGKV